MELVYEADKLVEVRIGYPCLQSKLTPNEKMAFFACDTPNAVVWQNVDWLEKNSVNPDGTPKTTLALTVQSMVTEGLITQARADEILS